MGYYQKNLDAYKQTQKSIFSVDPLPDFTPFSVETGNAAAGLKAAEEMEAEAFKLFYRDAHKEPELVAVDAPDGIVKAPSHYERYTMEPVNFIMINEMEFWRGNIIKYVARAGFKPYPNQDTTQSEITDLRKVQRYAEMRINQLEGRNPNDDG